MLVSITELAGHPEQLGERHLGVSDDLVEESGAIARRGANVVPEMIDSNHGIGMRSARQFDGGLRDGHPHTGLVETHLEFAVQADAAVSSHQKGRPRAQPWPVHAITTGFSDSKRRSTKSMN